MANYLTKDLSMTRGDTFTFLLPYETDNLALDLTGTIGHMHIKRTAYNTESEYAMSANYVGSATQGALTFTIPKEDSRNLSFGEFVYDIEVVMPGNGDAHTLIKGKFTIEPDVSQIS